MSRSGYIDDCDQWDLIRWRGQVASALRGHRGQAFLREMLRALDALPEKRLIADELVHDGEVCAIGSVGRARGIDMTQLDPECPEQLAAAFGIARQLVQEIEFINDDEDCPCSPEQRFIKVRKWVLNEIIVRPEELLMDKKS